MNRMACQAASTLSLRVTFFTPFDERGNKVRLGLSADHSVLLLAAAQAFGTTSLIWRLVMDGKRVSTSCR
jgi:hypothetical protein